MPIRFSLPLCLFAAWSLATTAVSGPEQAGSPNPGRERPAALALPDLRLTKKYYSPKRLQIIVANHGTACAEPAKVRVITNGHIRDLRLKTLCAGESASLQLTTDKPVDAAHSLVVIIDPANEITELNESNNLVD